MINKYLEPGAYTETIEGKKRIVVVTDVLNHKWNVDKNMQEYIEPLVVFRELIEGVAEHKRFSMPIDLFKSKFKAI